LFHAWAGTLRRIGRSCTVLLLTSIVTLLLPAQTGTTNQVLLLLIILYWLAEPSIARSAKGAVSSILLVGPWLLFLLTFAQRNGEHAIVSVPLPLAAVGLLWWTESSKTHRRERTLQASVAQVPEDLSRRPYEDPNRQENLGP